MEHPCDRRFNGVMIIQSEQKQKGPKRHGTTQDVDTKLFRGSKVGRDSDRPAWKRSKVSPSMGPIGDSEHNGACTMEAFRPISASLKGQKTVPIVTSSRKESCAFSIDSLISTTSRLPDSCPMDQLHGRDHIKTFESCGTRLMRKADPPLTTGQRQGHFQGHVHPDSPFKADQLANQAVVSFEKVKLTNNTAEKRPGYITKLKIDCNPFAKGFRDAARLTDFERESMKSLLVHQTLTSRSSTRMTHSSLIDCKSSPAMSRPFNCSPTFRQHAPVYADSPSLESHLDDLIRQTSPHYSLDHQPFPETTEQGIAESSNSRLSESSTTCPLPSIPFPPFQSQSKLSPVETDTNANSMYGNWLAENTTSYRTLPKIQSVCRGIELPNIHNCHPVVTETPPSRLDSSSTKHSRLAPGKNNCPFSSIGRKSHGTRQSSEDELSSPDYSIMWQKWLQNWIYQLMVLGRQVTHGTGSFNALNLQPTDSPTDLTTCAGPTPRGQNPDSHPSAPEPIDREATVTSLPHTTAASSTTEGAGGQAPCPSSYSSSSQSPASPSSLSSLPSAFRGYSLTAKLVQDGQTIEAQRSRTTAN